MSLIEAFGKTVQAVIGPKKFQKYIHITVRVSLFLVGEQSVPLYKAKER
jgi:hypothetical protein